MRTDLKKILPIFLALTSCATLRTFDPPTPYAPSTLELQRPAAGDLKTAARDARTIVLGELVAVREDWSYSAGCGFVTRVMRGGSCDGLVVAWRATIVVHELRKGKAKSGKVSGLMFIPRGNRVPRLGLVAVWFIDDVQVRDFLRERDLGVYRPAEGVWVEEDVILPVSPTDPALLEALP